MRQAAAIGKLPRFLQYPTRWAQQGGWIFFYMPPRRKAVPIARQTKLFRGEGK